MAALMQKASASGLATKASRPRVAGRAVSVVRAAATGGSENVWYPGAVRPSYLDGKLAGDRGFDPMGLGANPTALKWYQQSELVHARWAMLGVAGILVQEIAQPNVFWYDAALPQNLPGPFKNINMGGLLAIEFLLMHWVEVRRWQDYKNFGSVNDDPIFTGNKVSNPEMGYPGFDPLGLSKGNFEELKVKEIKNGRLAMIAFAGFTLQAQTTGKGPLGSLADHLGNPFGNNWSTNIGHCVTPATAEVQGLTIPLTCLWPGAH
jgi:light-harvesting complex I chlorophyll a/b binding protein 4